MTKISLRPTSSTTGHWRDRLSTREGEEGQADCEAVVEQHRAQLFVCSGDASMCVGRKSVVQ